MSTDSLSQQSVDAPEEPQDEQTQADFETIKAELQHEVDCQEEGFAVNYAEHYPSGEISIDWEGPILRDHAYHFKMVIERSIPVDAVTVMRSDQKRRRRFDRAAQ